MTKIESNILTLSNNLTFESYYVTLYLVIQMNEITQARIDFLQEHLSAIRKLLGWSAAVLGDKIGVTKQTISNLENKKTVMTKTQYIAFRSVMEHEIRNKNESTYLLEIAAAILDLDNLSDIKYERISEAMAFVSSAADNHLEESTAKTVIKSFLDNLDINGQVLSEITLSKPNPYHWLERINGYL